MGSAAEAQAWHRAGLAKSHRHPSPDLTLLLLCLLLSGLPQTPCSVGAIRQLGENPVERDPEEARAVGAQREGLCVNKNSWFPAEASAPGA